MVGAICGCPRTGGHARDHVLTHVVLGFKLEESGRQRFRVITRRLILKRHFFLFHRAWIEVGWGRGRLVGRRWWGRRGRWVVVGSRKQEAASAQKEAGTGSHPLGKSFQKLPEDVREFPLGGEDELDSLPYRSPAAGAASPVVGLPTESGMAVTDGHGQSHAL